MQANHSGLQILDRAIDVVMAFTRTGKALGAAELGQMLGLPAPAVAEILATLSRRGWVEQGPEEGTYRLGPVFLLLAGTVQTYTDLREAALPFMRELQAATGETVNLNIVHEGERICVEKVESAHRLRQVSYVGERSPLYAGASAKVLLAYLPEPEIEQVMGRLELLTPGTIADPGALRTELVGIRTRGYAQSHGERSPGIVSIAAPVRDGSRQVVAGLSLFGPASRFTPDRLPALTDAVVQAANRLSERLGYSVHA